eukprot:COSAG01_NODE_7973_length_2968_cov_8.650052_2_plen_151_part_00
MMEAAITAQGPKLVKQVKGVIQYVITGGPNKKKWTWHTDLKNGDGAISEGKAKKVRQPQAACAYGTDGANRDSPLPECGWAGWVVEAIACVQADLTVTMKDDVFMDIAAGTLKPQTAFMRGKLKIKGSMGLAMKLQGVIDVARKEFGPKL